MALYLKYRPQHLDQLIGQEKVTKTLLSAYINNKLSHAYLFVGPRGTGKTSTARILAKMVNCEKGGENVPCNECVTCLSITDGSCMDLIEIDAASNRGIDDIRALRDTISLSPSSAKKKIYIIDEVHMLTTEAFNALLKTLEDPPIHAMFILATTEAQKIPQTILSRTQRLDFTLATSAHLETALKHIIKEEKIDIEEDALKMLIKSADGSFRDGVKLLDQIAGLGEKITTSNITSVLKVAPFEVVIKFVKSLFEKDTKSALILTTEHATSGGEIREFVLSTMDVLRSIMLIKNDLGTLLVEPVYNEQEYSTLKELATNSDIQRITTILETLQTTIEKIKSTSLQSLPLELAIVEVCSENQPVVIPANAGIQRSQDRKLGLIITSSSEVDPHLRGDDKEEAPSNDDVIEVVPSSSPDVIILQEKWNFVLETIKADNFSLEALLKAVNILDCSDGRVLLEVPYSFHQRILETPKSRDLLESVLSDVLGKQVRVSCVLANKPLKVEDVANIEVAADDEIIRAAAEIFNAQVVE